jgi:hypothetical protein
MADTLSSSLQAQSLGQTQGKYLRAMWAELEKMFPLEELERLAPFGAEDLVAP